MFKLQKSGASTKIDIVREMRDACSSLRKTRKAKQLSPKSLESLLIGLLSTGATLEYRKPISMLIHTSLKFLYELIANSYLLYRKLERILSQKSKRLLDIIRKK